MRSSCAWAPGHITGFFATRLRDDPVKSGSVGAGFSIDLGATVYVEEADRDQHVLNGTVTRMGVVERVHHILAPDRRFLFDMRTELPLSQGFGMSAAISIATAMALIDLCDLEADPYEAAHVAEVLEGTGLGDVAGITAGGFEVRLREGVPPHGVVRALDFDVEHVFLKVVGDPISTAGVITSFKKRKAIDRHGEEMLKLFLEDPTLQNFLDLSRKFGEVTGLISPEAKRILVGKNGAMCMIGNSVFSLDPLEGGVMVKVGGEPTIMDTEGCRR